MGNCEPRGSKNGKGVRVGVPKELCKGAERRRELIIGQESERCCRKYRGIEMMRDGEEKMDISNGGNGGRPTKREWRGAEEVVGRRDCCAFILLCSRLLKHHLRKRLLSRVTAALR